MAKGGNNQRSNGSRFSKPYDASNSFVKKVALRVSDYIGGLFGSSMKADDPVPRDHATVSGSEEITVSSAHYETIDSGKSLGLQRSYDYGVNDSSSKRIKLGTKRKFVPDLPISPIASTSNLFQSSVNHNFDIQNSEDFITSVAGPSGLQNQKYAQTNAITTPTSTSTNIKANGATDNHSDSSESTSGCSSLVPQSDRLSQSAFVSNSRKKILEEKLQYARQLKQTRASMYLNRSIPVVNDTAGSKRKPSFDVSVYGSPIFDKSSVREKMVSSPFYTGQTSYGGASAYRRPRTALYSHPNGRTSFERKDGVQIQVKQSHYGSTEDLSNMSHTAKRILEALEQFSTPISDAKRVPVCSGSPPLGRKRKRFGDSVESVSSLSSTRTTDVSKGPLISGLCIPTVPDLLKLKRLEKIQDSTAAARQVAVQKQEYSLPTDVQPSKHTGKIVTKIKDKEKDITFERPSEVNLPKIPLPISTLPRFDFKLQPVSAIRFDAADTSAGGKTLRTINALAASKSSESSKTFKFSPPISLSAPENIKITSKKSNFTFSTPLKAEAYTDKSDNAVLSNLSNFMSTEALSKLKRKSVNDKPSSSIGVEPAKELKSGSVMDLLRKTLEGNKKSEDESVGEQFKSLNETWECDSCLIRNLKESKNCSGCKAQKISVTSKNIKITVSSPVVNTFAIDSEPVTVMSGFGNKFRPPSDSWTCKECFVNNNSTATKCIACENPKPQSDPAKEIISQVKPPASGFGDLFKKKAGQWECSVCLIQNKDSDVKCAACETPKPGAKVDKPEPPKFNFGIPAAASGFKFGIDKADVKSDTKPVELPVATQSNGPAELAVKPLNSVTTSFGVYTFGIPSASIQNTNEKEPDMKLDTSKKIEQEKQQGVGINESSTKTDSIAPGKDAAEPSEKVIENDSSSKVEDLDKKKGQNVADGNFMAQSFSFNVQNKTIPSSLFSFGSNNAAQPARITESSVTATTSITTSSTTITATASVTTTAISAANTNTNTLFVSGFKMPETIPTSNTSFTFGQPTNLVSSQMSVNTTGSNDMNKSSPFPSFMFSSNAPVSASNVSNTSNTKIGEAGSESCTSSTVVTSNTTNSVFGSSVFKDSKLKLNFGSSGVGSGSTEFGAGIKLSNSSDSTTTTAISMSTPIFSATSNVFNGPAVTSTNTVFGSSGGLSFTVNTTQGLTSNTEQGFRPAAEPSFKSSVPSFGSTNTQTTGFGIFNAPTNTFGSTTASAGFGANPTSAPTFGSPFGQPSPTPDKLVTPFVFGGSNNNVTSTNAAAPPTTAPNLFTFGAPKPEAKRHFPSTFGQNSNTFTFRGLSPAADRVFPSSSGNTNSTFGNTVAAPFGQSSAPANFGASPQKFVFPSSSQQTQSTPQPFQFGASTPQTQATSAPATFSLSVPQTFNFTGGQTPTFSATPTAVIPQRRVVRAIRRTQR